MLLSFVFFIGYIVEGARQHPEGALREAPSGLSARCCKNVFFLSSKLFELTLRRHFLVPLRFAIFHDGNSTNFDDTQRFRKAGFCCVRVW